MNGTLTVEFTIASPFLGLPHLRQRAVFIRAPGHDSKPAATMPQTGATKCVSIER
jgi:hypothetical protein